MPVNLNALIRYKTLDKCFSKRSSVATIDYLIEQCSAALYEATGRKSGVSERTIRNDIRILRSSILDFNAPIIVKNGIYSYSSKNYSIFDNNISDKDLFLDIQELLVEEFTNISNKNLPYLLKKLTMLTNKEVPDKYLPKTNDKDSHIFQKQISVSYESMLDNYINRQKVKSKFWSKPQPINLKWNLIFDAI
ncbi:hypothetical protein Q4509_11450 [Oceanihabitans sp. 1_MG-2023]|uniref:hypothetical protein n=1 Tax=Flavobacteriaceae TaxID=49546 RepID=UPI001C09DF86|nr:MULTISPECIES: hypothetical protein [Flavobacteriaceae]MDO6623467.1 hypothetical protein [Oceanihabitans sp. 1_MG-2023]